MEGVRQGFKGFVASFSRSARTSGQPPKPLETAPLTPKRILIDVPSAPDDPANEIVLVSNGPGELYTWVRPVLSELRRQAPGRRVTVSLIPCQFASGQETRIAGTFGADRVTSPKDFVQLMAGRRSGFPARAGAVLGLGGSAPLTLQLAQRLHAPAYRYSFAPYWHPKLAALFVDSGRTAQRARLLGAAGARLEVVGNLVADAVELAEPAETDGRPHILMLGGSRDAFAVHVIPFLLALADALHTHLPNARFVWPVSRLLSPEAVAQGIAGVHKDTLGGIAGMRDGDTVIAPGGARLELVPEETRYAQMRAADLAVTIPGTNTLELGIAGVPSVVLLPLNRPEVIPLEGPGHWLSLLPIVGPTLKRRAVLLAAPHLPVSLPNNLSGEKLMVELKGVLTLDGVLRETLALLEDKADLTRRRERLLATMPRPGAARKLVSRVLESA